MKNSNIQWIGEIPDDWEVTKIGQLYQLRNQKVSDRDYPPLSVTMNGIVPQMEHVAKTNAHDDRKLVKKGDFAINSRSDRRGSCGISKYDGSVSLINTVLQPLNEMNPNYYDWLFHTVQFADEFYKWGHGIVDDLWSTNWQDMKNISVCVPPLSTQTSIATYLDSKCSQIDGLIADINKQIETLNELKKSTITEAVTKGLNKNAKLKDSGIQWIGRIPEGWRVTKIGFIADTCSGGTPPSSNADFFDGDIKWVCSYDLHEKGIIDTEKHLTNIGASMIAGKIQMPNSILIAMYGGDGTIGNSGFLLVKARTNQAVCSIHFDETIIIPLYAFFFIRFLRPFWMYYAQGSRKDPNINQEIVKNMKILTPPLAEQRAIATYLDTKCSEFDSIISDKQKQISTLEAYKKSLIYEYVTGKNVPPVIDN